MFSEMVRIYGEKSEVQLQKYTERHNQKKISQEEFEDLMNKRVKGRTKREWVNMYRSYQTGRIEALGTIRKRFVNWTKEVFVKK